jgi:hypothetical protein
MFRKLGSYRPSHATVVAYLALFVALGGSSYAAISIGSGNIRNSSIRSEDIGIGQVRSSDIRNNDVQGIDIANGTIGSSDVKDRSLLASDFAPGELHAGSQGAQGPQGAQGDKGDTGAAGASSFAADCNEGLPAGDVMVRAGATCIDRYEASIWDAPSGGNQITGALPCNVNGQDCKGKIFARSVAGVTPRVSITWFQAQQALANAGKRLPTNAEWQAAVAGTPDSTACNVSTAALQNTGANAGCVSAWGANDMVGNLDEWVADWDETAGDCDHWPMTGYGSDISCVGSGDNDIPSRFPGALFRGGDFSEGTDAGPFAVSAIYQPSRSFSSVGFRGAR